MLKIHLGILTKLALRASESWGACAHFRGNTASKIGASSETEGWNIKYQIENNYCIYCSEEKIIRIIMQK